MNKEDGLFFLIDSLSPSEKRYFRLFAKRHVLGAQNEYLAVFDGIDKQFEGGVYDERLLTQYLRKAGYRTVLRAAKNYLQMMILRSMRQFNEESNVSRSLQSRLMDIDFLLEKGQTSKAMALLRKAKRVALLYHKYMALLSLLHAERRILRLQQTRNSLASIEKIEKDEDQALARIRDESNLRRLHDRTFLLIRGEMQARVKKEEAIEKLARHPLLNESHATKSFDMELLRLLTLSDLALLRGNTKHSRAALYKLICLYDDHPHQFRDEPLRYINILNNYLNSCFQLQRFDEFPGLLRRMKQLGSHSREARFQVFRNGLFLEMLYLLNTRQLKACLELVPQITAGLKAFERKLPVARMLSFLYNLITLFFFNEQYSDALRWLNRLRERDYPDVRRDIQHAARLFQWVLLFELGKFDLLDATLRNSIRFFKQYKRMNQFETLLANLFADLLNEADSRKQKTIFKNGKEKFNEAEAELKNELFFEEVQLWLESRVSGKSLAGIFIKAG
jgi:hypothetical protein